MPKQKSMYVAQVWRKGVGWMGGYPETRKAAMETAKRLRYSYREYPRGEVKVKVSRVPESGTANPGGRTVHGSTGWLQAKAVRIVKQGGRTVVQIKRAAKRRSR